MKGLFLLYNPKSGRERIKHYLSDIIELFAKAGYDLMVPYTIDEGYGGSYQITEIHCIKDAFSMIY